MGCLGTPSGQTVGRGSGVREKAGEKKRESSAVGPRSAPDSPRIDRIAALVPCERRPMAE